MRKLSGTIRRLGAGSKGFTLIEAMIAMAVFSIGVLGILVLQTNGVRNNTLAEDAQQSTVFARASIEELMATDFIDQRIGDDVVDCPPIDPRFTLCSSSRDQDFIPGTKRVDVRVVFFPEGMRPQSTTFRIFKPEIK